MHQQKEHPEGLANKSVKYVSKLKNVVEDREAWRATVHGGAKSQT